MRENKLRTLWEKDQNVVNGWLAIPSSYATEVMASCGFDSLTIDMQHGMSDYSDLIPMLQAISTTEAAPMARVRWNEPGAIMRLLDAGCYGIICPMINSVAECEAFVQACRYPPNGYRSFGPVRASVYAGADYFNHANTTVVTMAMIETKQAIDKLDDILSVPGLDSIYVGPADLAISLGRKPMMDHEDAPMLDILKHVVERCKAHGVRAGLHCGTAEYALKMVDMGFRFTTLASDSRFMTLAAMSAVNTMKTAKTTSKIVY